MAQFFLSVIRFWYEPGRASKTWQKFRIVVIHST
ncbi:MULTISPECIES: AAA-like domain-containing protein [unclassified Microcoleus]